MLPPRRWPDVVPILVSPDRTVTLRAHVEDDLPAVVELARDPQTRRWTDVSLPFGGFGPVDARAFLDRERQGWNSGAARRWSIEAVRPDVGGPAYCGHVGLALGTNGRASVDFGLHPAARGQGIMVAALRLALAYGFEADRLQVISWTALAGNWPSRRAAERAGVAVEGLRRRHLLHRGELVDVWVGSVIADDPVDPGPEPLRPVLLDGERVRLRPFADGDAGRIAEACNDPLNRHWLSGLPQPYDAETALAYVDASREQAARRTALLWGLADPVDDRLLGALGLEGFDGYARRGEIGYWSHPDGRGRGVVTEAVRLVSAHAETTGLTRSLLIRCAADNTPSRRVAEAAGFTECGRQPRCELLGDGSVTDLVLYSRP